MMSLLFDYAVFCIILRTLILHNQVAVRLQQLLLLDVFLKLFYDEFIYH